VADGARKRCLVFSGDLGPRGAPILEDAEGFHQAYVVVMESTYGDHNHQPLPETVAEFEQIIADAVRRQGKVLIPTFAVGRAQLLLYLLAVMFRHKTVPKFPVFVDSPMAIEASKIYAHHLELFDDDFKAMQRQRPLAQDLDSVKFTASGAESMAINQVAGPCLILAGAGMCNAGRILHHLKLNLWRPETDVIIVGFQAEGTLGRQLVEGARYVSVFGEKIAVKARVHTLGGFSAHAGQNDLLRWFDQLAPCQPQVILTHGEAKGRDALGALLLQRYQLTVQKPMLGDVIDC
jgi:metallo-beta-lactamase family protein